MVKAGGGGLRKFFHSISFYHENFTVRIFILKNPGLTSGGEGVTPPPQNIVGLKTLCMILYMLVKLTYQI